ncbi:MAG: rod shape-determining protein MreC [Rubrivivax sp.]|jgi:rod shape-determining protein MreC
MPLGTLDRTPPPFFRQGPSALTRLVFFSALAIFLMVADARFRMVEPLRKGLAIVLLPVQRALLVPVELAQGGGAYLQSLGAAQAAEQRAARQLALMADKAAKAAVLQEENRQLRALLALPPDLAPRAQAAEVLYEAADPFSRKLFINRGQAQGVVSGSPVINDVGVLGQVTRVYALTSEVTLLSDKDAAIPVLNARTQQRGAAFGGTAGMELRYTSANADVKVGDALQTSGVDGVYPPGLAVATVLSVERRVESGFARIALAPAASPDAVRHVLVLDPLGLQMPPRPDATPDAALAKLGKAHRAAPAASGAASGRATRPGVPDGTASGGVR